MSLDKDKLATELRKFCDPDYGSFADYPATQAAAKTQWGNAFDTYIKDMVVKTPSTVTPTSSSATFAGVKAAFEGQLQFANTLNAATPAQELASAWAAGVNAITLVPGAGYLNAPPPPTPITVIDPFSTVDACKATLQADLLGLFQDPSLSGEDRAKAIANAIHTATTSAITTTCTYTTTSGTTVTPIPNSSLGFG
jgi:hypothetical protein